MQTKHDQHNDASHYNENTHHVLNILREADKDARQQLLKNLQSRDASKQSVEIISKQDGSQCLCLYHPSDKARLERFILNRFDEFRSKGMTKKQYAKHFFNCSSSYICNIISRESCPRDVLITGALMMHPPLSAAELDHALMEVGHPGLFTNTYDQDTNLRNFVLKRFLGFVAEAKVPKNLIVWPELADRMLIELEMEPLNRQNTDYSDGSAPTGDHREQIEQLWTQLRPLIFGWLAEAEKACVPVNYMVLRNRHLNERLKRLNPKVGTSAFFQDLASAAGLNAPGAKALFANAFPVGDKHSNHGNRDALVLGAAFLGCTLDETNRILQEANHPLLYVFRQDEIELTHIAKLLQNELDRAHRAPAP